MKSVSGKYWEEEKFNKRFLEKIKNNYNLNDLIALHALSNNFEKDEIYSFKNDIDLSNPFLNKLDFKKAITILDESISKNETICIIGDYDVDGCISTSLLVKLLKAIDAKYFYYIPNRFTDGYGSSVDLLKKLKKKNPQLVIMVDNGSSSSDSIDYLKKNHIKSIIIDHHEIYKPYPKSDVLINPKKNCDYSDYSYFCSGVLTYFFIDLYIRKKKIKLNFSKYLYMVLLTIVSDIMPLRKINRYIAKIVFKNIKINNHYFFKKIFEIKKINKPLEIDDFAFLFGPIINSAGRLNDPNIIVELFTNNNYVIKDKIINKLISLNEKRKLIEKNIFEKIDFEKIKINNDPIIILEDNNISEGLIGIVASKIKTFSNKPSIIITKSGNLYKGSARSTKNFSIGRSIKFALDIKLLESGGGHNMAAGFTIKKKNLVKFKTFINKIYQNNNTELKYNYLSKISLNSLNKNFLLDLEQAKPYGEENLNPYFLIENIKIINIKIIKNKFLSCFVKNRSGKLISAVSFNFLDSDLSKNILYNKNELSMIVQIKENFWNNKKNTQLVIIDIFNTSIKA